MQFVIPQPIVLLFVMYNLSLCSRYLAAFVTEGFRLFIFHTTGKYYNQNYYSFSKNLKN